jgi:hypothetical protein
MDTTLKSLAASVKQEDSDAAFRTAMIDGMAKLADAMTALMLRTEAFQAETRAHREDMQRRLDALERRDERRTDRALVAAVLPAALQERMPKSLGALLNRVYNDWRTVGLVVLSVVYIWQAFIAPHVALVLR